MTFFLVSKVQAENCNLKCNIWGIDVEEMRVNIVSRFDSIWNATEHIKRVLVCILELVAFAGHALLADRTLDAQTVA